MVVAAAIGALLLAMATRGAISHPPTNDELLHVLAAQGVVATGEPVILDGIYQRAEWFTRVVARVFESSDVSLEGARRPALFFGILLVALTGLWVTRLAGLLAGVTAAALLAITPVTIELSVFARFYTLHALVVMLAFIAVYQATVAFMSRNRGTAIAWSALGIAMLPIAWHLQITTLIAIGAATIGVGALVLSESWTATRAVIVRRPTLSFTVVAVLAAAGVMLGRQLGVLEEADAVPLWAAQQSDDVGYYLRRLALEWPLAWPLIPLAVVAAISGFRRPAIFCATVALSAIAVHSVLAAKSMRYAYYALPMLSAIIGFGVSIGSVWLTSWLATIPRLQPSARAGYAAAALLALVAIASQEVQLGARLVAGKASWQQLNAYASETDWNAALPALRPRLDDNPTVIVSSAVKGAFYLGNYDFELNASTVPETETGEEFGRDLRTGRRAIGSRSSLQGVLEESPASVIVIDGDKLGKTAGVANDVVALIESRCEAIAVPAGSGVHAWACRRLGAQQDSGT